MSEREKSLRIVAESDAAPPTPPADAAPPRGCLCFGGPTPNPTKVPSAAASSLAQPGGALLCHASYAGDLETVTDALNAGVHANATRFVRAHHHTWRCRAQSAGCKERLLHADSVACGTQDGASPLLLAAQQGHTEVVTALLEGGASPDLRFEAVRAKRRFSRGVEK